MRLVFDLSQLTELWTDVSLAGQCDKYYPNGQVVVSAFNSVFAFRSGFVCPCEDSSLYSGEGWASQCGTQQRPFVLGSQKIGHPF